jgi:adenine phosphoribosyltransferase
MDIKALIRNVPDYPIKGIMFKDITTLIKDPAGFAYTIDRFIEKYKDAGLNKIAGIESRGFIFGAVLAYRLNIGFVPIRKKGKLPAETIGHDYELEYGTDRIEIHTDAVEPGEKVLVVDDLIATGGTAIAAITLIEKMGGQVVSTCFVIDLPFLGGSDKIKKSGHDFYTLCEFDNEHE